MARPSSPKPKKFQHGLIFFLACSGIFTAIASTVTLFFYPNDTTWILLFSLTIAIFLIVKISKYFS